MALAIEWVSGDFVAIAAIVAGGIVSLVAVTMTGRNEREARREERRLETYSRILPIVWQTMEQASQHAISPGLTTVPDADDAEVRKAQSLLMLIGSPEARDAFGEWRKLLAGYWPLVWNASVARRRADDLIDPVTDRSMQGWEETQGAAEIERLKLVEPIGKLEEAATRLEKAMRAELTN
jgi:hypothetical protein